jgi:MFS family permease
MSRSVHGLRSHATLALCTVLHAFTHAYGTMLVPLYLLVVADLKLPGVSYASAIVTIYGLVYCLGSFPAGVMADRRNRKALLGIGLIGNALAIAAMGITRKYELLMLAGVLAGIFGTLFHPAANALATAHYPKSPGMAIGVLGMGAGIGFFAGPQYAGWRAQLAGDWQRPLIDAGIVGLIIGVIFLFVSREVVRQPSDQPHSRAAGRKLGWKIASIAAVLGCRDFAGLATISLASIYLQKAHGFDVKRTGFVVGAMMLCSVIVNPVAVYYSAGGRRLPLLATVLFCGGAVLVTVPFWPIRVVLPVLMTYQAFQLCSYALSDAAMLERVRPEVRGRVVGLFLTIAGTFSSTAPFVMGWWTDLLGARAHVASAYLPIFATLAAMMCIAAFSTPLIRRLGQPEAPPIEPFSQTTPATVEPAM